ncbi:RNA polymerase sigma factor [Pseudoxanthomonas sp. UTMC 1351]|uniref:RNA polymerase sigma factor n=1 Tax=Pseudoxanthomonas sp. UTMC 1351 TaxID=2695853 RepID=UPI0034CDA0A8
MDMETYRQLRAQAIRLTRRADEAEDLVQDTLLAGLEARRSDLAWLSGVLRNQAAMAGRGAIRRRKREVESAADEWGIEQQDVPIEATMPVTRAWLTALPPSARRVAVLALHGLSADEIRWILRIESTALRQRLTRIRKALGELPPELRAESLALAYVRNPARSVDLQFGLVRRALKAAMRVGEGLGTHDADGHLLVINTGAHTSAPPGNE